MTRMRTRKKRRGAIRVIRQFVSFVFAPSWLKRLLRSPCLWASERRFYQKITDIYALSADYDKNAPITKDFFATVQNKLHWAITGKTAAEIIYDSYKTTQPDCFCIS